MRILGWILYTLLCLVIAVLLAEMALRRTWRREMLAGGYPYPRGYYVADREAGYDIAAMFPPSPLAFRGTPHDVWSNALACFDRPYEDEDGYILLCGDSFSWGYCPFDQAWGAGIEEMLGRRVVRAGVSGYGTKQALLKVRRLLKILPSPPDLIVLGYFGYNDLADDYVFPGKTVTDGYLVSTHYVADRDQGTIYVRTPAEIRDGLRVERARERGLRRWLETHSILFHYAWRALKDMARSHDLLAANPVAIPLSCEPTSGRPWLDKAWDDHLANLRKLRDLAEGVGARLIVVIIPAREHVYPSMRGPFWSAAWEQPIRRVSAFCEANDIEAVNLLPAFRRAASAGAERGDEAADLYWRCDPHWNAKGHRLAAECLTAYLAAAPNPSTESADQAAP